MKYTVNHAATIGNRTIGIKRVFIGDTIEESYMVARAYAYKKARQCRERGIKHTTTIQGQGWTSGLILNS